MRKLVSLLAVVLLVSCLPTPTPHVVKETVEVTREVEVTRILERRVAVIEPLGISVSFPDGWTHEVQEDRVVFATSTELVSSQEFVYGARMVILRWEAQEQTPEEMMSDMVFSALWGHTAIMVWPERRSIGGQDGAIVDFGRIPGDVFEHLHQGFVAMTQHGDWRYEFWAVSAAHDWPEYGPQLEAMLDSVQFAGAEVPSTILTRASASDNWEPDNRLGAASLIEVGETQTHNLHVEGDCDWVYFKTEEGLTYVIEALNLGNDIDTVIELYNEDKNLLGSDDDGGDDGLGSRLWTTATKDGVLYARIRDWAGGSAGPGATYDVSVRQVAPAPSLTVEVIERNYTNPSAGISMWYPEGWLYDESIEFEGAVHYLFFQSSERAPYPLETVASMVVMAGDLRDQTFGEFFVSMIMWNLPLEGADEDQVSSPQPLSISGQNGAVVAFRGNVETSDGTKVE